MAKVDRRTGRIPQTQRTPSRFMLDTGKSLKPLKPMQIVYHGTDEATAKKILKTGFKPGTFFALHLEDSIGFGGTYIFEVAVESHRIPHTGNFDRDWEFRNSDTVPPSQIVELKHYPKAKSLMENKELGEAVFQSNMTAPLGPKKLPRDVILPSGKKTLEQQPAGRVLAGVGYADKGHKRLTRKPHKGWRKVKYT